jgi:hypothetical protein
MDRIEELQRQLVRVDTGGAPLLTISLDLTPGTDGIPSARQVLKQMWRTVESRFGNGDLKHEGLRSYERDQQAVEEMWEPALQGGARGLFYFGCARTGFRATLETPYPPRHSAYLSTSPWMFEFARYRYLASKPIVVASVDWRELHARRIQYGEVHEEVEFQHYEEAVSQGGRYDTSGIGATGGDVQGGPPGGGGSPIAGRSGADTAGGWHAKTRIEKSVMEHKEITAREDAGRLAELVGNDDILMLAGPEEPREELRRQLPERLQDQVLEAPEIQANTAEHIVVDAAMHLAADLQFIWAEREVERWREGNLKERAIAGLDDARKAVERGQLGTLILHEDLATHFGSSRDGREHQGYTDSRAVSDLLRAALAGSVQVLFTSDPAVLPEQGGALGMLRWS